MLFVSRLRSTEIRPRIGLHAVRPDFDHRGRGLPSVSSADADRVQKYAKLQDVDALESARLESHLRRRPEGDDDDLDIESVEKRLPRSAQAENLVEAAENRVQADGTVRLSRRLFQIRAVCRLPRNRSEVLSVSFRLPSRYVFIMDRYLSSVFLKETPTLRP